MAENTTDLTFLWVSSGSLAAPPLADHRVFQILTASLLREYLIRKKGLSMFP